VREEEFILGRYEILDTITDGHRASLCKARDHDLDRLVALKILTVGDAECLDDLRAETRLLLQLQHRYLPTVRHDFGLRNRYFIVIDWVDGIDLARKLDADGHPGLVYSSVLDWIAHVAEALDYLHEQDSPIVHGDVKPSNIVLARTNRAVLLDFGIARRAGELSNAGTRGFMAPEVAGNEPVSPATDVYGLAATTYMLLTGTPPGFGPPVFPDIEGVDVAALEQVLHHGLAMDPSRRYASAGEFAARLRTANESLPDSTKTLLATEFVDFDVLWDQNPELMDDVERRVESLVRIAVDESDGRTAVDSGGGHMLTGFLSASGALRAALAIRSRLGEDCSIRDRAVQLRIALHTGEPEHRNGQFRGASVNRVRMLCRAAEPGQILVSGATAGLLFDRVPAGTRLVEVMLPRGATTNIGAVYAVETDELPPLTATPAPPHPAGPIVPPPANAPPPRRAPSDRLVGLVRERDELDELINTKLQQEAEAQRAGQPGLADGFGRAAAELVKRRIEIQREIERLEAQGDGG
jgi:serine/threonine protein kinase